MDEYVPDELRVEKRTHFQTTARQPAYVPDGLGGSPSLYDSARGLKAVRAGEGFIQVAPIKLSAPESRTGKIVKGVAMSLIGMMPR